MRMIDLNARRQSRDPVSVTAGDGHVFALPTFLPLKAMTASLRLGTAASDPAGALAAVDELYTALFGADADAAREMIGLEEVQQIITEAYQLNPGESSASPAS